jgi:hypothetical protein
MEVTAQIVEITDNPVTEFFPIKSADKNLMADRLRRGLHESEFCHQVIEIVVVPVLYLVRPFLRDIHDYFRQQIGDPSGLQVQGFYGDKTLLNWIQRRHYYPDFSLCQMRKITLRRENGEIPPKPGIRIQPVIRKKRGMIVKI